MTAVQMIVGLGNPGNQYENTRHNAGADFVALLAEQTHCALQQEKRYHGRYGKTFLGRSEIHLLIPSTFMNLSGQSAQALANYFKVPADSILVVHDELDLPPGSARFKQGGGHGGHNGLRDIIEKLSGNRDFHRLRIGIGHPGNAKLVHNYVLGRAPGSERERILACFDAALSALPDLIEGNPSKAMNALHSVKA